MSIVSNGNENFMRIRSISASTLLSLQSWLCKPSMKLSNETEQLAKYVLITIKKILPDKTNRCLRVVAPYCTADNKFNFEDKSSNSTEIHLHVCRASRFCQHIWTTSSLLTLSLLCFREPEQHRHYWHCRYCALGNLT